MGVEAFLANRWGRLPEHFKGAPGRFASLLPWPTLNTILQEHRLDAPRIRVVKEGKDQPRGAYLQDRNGISGASAPSVRIQELNALLRSGALLVIDAIEETSAPIRALAEDLERTLSAPIQINAYAGWQETQGFKTHWDDHDVMVLQVAGKKSWRVFEDNKPYPVDYDEREVPPPTPHWAGVLEAGDVLYIPRGWWHDAKPVGEPTLHLTIGIGNTTGLDVVAWLSKRLRQVASVRKDVPRFGGPEAQAAYLAELRSTLMEQVNTLDLEAFFTDFDGQAPVLGAPSLPWAIMPANNALAPTQTIKWLPPRRVRFEVSDGKVTFYAIGSRWAFSGGTEPILKELEGRRWVPLARLQEIGATRGSAPEAVTAFVVELLNRGLATVEP